MPTVEAAATPTKTAIATAPQPVVPQPIVQDAEAEVGIIGYGTSHWAIEESRIQLQAEYGIKTAYLRLRAYPFPDEVAAFMRRYPRIYVVEQTRDAQMKMLLRNDLPVEDTTHARSVLHYNGLPIDARSVTDEILIQEGRKVRPAPSAVAASGVAVLRED